MFAFHILSYIDNSRKGYIYRSRSNHHHSSCNMNILASNPLATERGDPDKLRIEVDKTKNEEM